MTYAFAVKSKYVGPFRDDMSGEDCEADLLAEFEQEVCIRGQAASHYVAPRQDRNRRIYLCSWHLDRLHRIRGRLPHEG